jgi:hypothetical protein
MTTYQLCDYPYIPPSTSWSLRRRTFRSSQRSYAFPYSTRIHPTSPAALNCVASDVLSFPVFHAKASRAHSEPRLGAFDLLSASYASIPCDSATCHQKFPRGCPSAFLSVLSISFLLTNSANPSLRRGHRQSLHWFGRNGLTSISKEVKIQASRWYLHVGSRHWRILGFGLRPRTATRTPATSTIPYRLMHPCFIPRSTWRKGFHHQNPS